MLVLTRGQSESIRIGDNITVTVVRIGPNKVRLGIDAPKSTNIVRTELIEEGDPSKVAKTEPNDV